MILRFPSQESPFSLVQPHTSLEISSKIILKAILSRLLVRGSSSTSSMIVGTNKYG